MNRTSAGIGLTLSLALHIVVLSLVGMPTGPLLTPTVQVVLRQVDQTVASADAVTPTVEQVDSQTQAQEPPEQPAAKPPRIRTEQPPIAAAEPLRKPETSVARPPTTTAPTPPPVTEKPVAVESPTRQKETATLARSAPETSAPASTAIPAETPFTHNLPPATKLATGAVTPPSYIPRPRPYPRLAKQRGWEGTVQLQVDIAADGTVTRVLLEQSSGYPLLDDAAIRHIGKSRFRPARRDGTPIDISVQLPVVFELK